MRRTEDPPASVSKAILAGVADLAGLVSLLITLVVLLSSDGKLRSFVPIVLGASLTLIGIAEIALTRCRDRRGKLRRAREGHGRLCAIFGVLQLSLAFVCPPAAAFSGFFITLGLVWLGCRGPRRNPQARRRERPSRLAPRAMTVITLICVMLAYLGVAGAVVVQREDVPADPEGHEAKEEDTGEGRSEHSSGEDETPSYAELCPALPNPVDIGHHLGDLFRYDGAIKAGCGTPAFNVPGTGTWVAAGMCFSERRSVAVWAPGRPPSIVYGEAAEFTWQAAREGVLTAVEAARPGDGDVDLVETLAGTYGFARATRSAAPGTQDPHRCDEVGGTAEPFARMPPPLLWLWAALVRENATWYWPTPDRSGNQEAVTFVSTEGIPQGTCISDTLCSVEDETENRSLEGAAFVTLDDLREFMPAEEPAGG